jgi:hypothetical protein
VCDVYADIRAHHGSIRHGGFAPKCTDEEVITMEICGEYFKCATDKDLYAYFRTHYHEWFPLLPDRTTFVRQEANLWQIKVMIQKKITSMSGQYDDSVQSIDTIPLPICEYVRAKRDRCFKPDADYGYCAAKKLHYYGFKLGLRISQAGMITAYPLLSARPHDIQALTVLVEGHTGYVPADKGFIDAFRHALLEERHGVLVVTPQKRGAKTPSRFDPETIQTGMRLRKRIETVGSQLSEHFAITRIRVRDIWHYQARLIRKILAHTVGVFFHLQMGRYPLSLAQLVTD